MKNGIPSFDDVAKPLVNNFGFADELNSLDKNFEHTPVKREKLKDFIEMKPTSLLQESKC